MVFLLIGQGLFNDRHNNYMKFYFRIEMNYCETNLSLLFIYLNFFMFFMLQY